MGEVEELERQVERGSMFTLAVLHRGAQRMGRAEALLGGVLEVLAAKGLVTGDELDAALCGDGGDDAAAGEPVEEEDAPPTPAVGWPTIALRTDPPDAGAPDEPAVDCAARMHVCQAVCCRLRFMLSAEEIDAGAVRWDIGHPYVIRHDAGGMCVHNEAGSRGCTVYTDRPRVCRQYDCTHDGRIWTDFDGMVLNEEWIAEHLGPRDISVASVVPAMMPTPVTIGPRPDGPTRREQMCQEPMRREPMRREPMCQEPMCREPM
jgi:Fe-S-cluster containining protein